MSPPPPPSDQPGPTVDEDPERAEPTVDPAPAEHSPVDQPAALTAPASPTAAPTEPDPVVDTAAKPAPAKTIPDHDPFTDTDVYPELGQRPSTGGFAGLSRSSGPGTPAHQSPYRPQIGPAGPTGGTGGWPTPPPNGPHGPETSGASPAPAAPSGSGFGPPSAPPDPGSATGSGSTAVLPVMVPSQRQPPHHAADPGHQAPYPQPASNPDPTAWPRTADTGHIFGPPPQAPWEVGGARAGAGPGAGPSGPLTATHPPVTPSRRGLGKGSLLTLAALTGVVLLGLGALGGAMLSNANDNANDVDIAAAPETTATARVDQSANSSGQTSRSEPRPSTTAAPAAGQAPTSTVPPTALTTATTVTSASTADPNALVADFHWSPDPPAAGQSISITDASTGNPNRWTWRWNGNTVSSSQPKGFTTSLREDTAITLTVCRGNGSANCASVTKTITVS